METHSKHIPQLEPSQTNLLLTGAHQLVMRAMRILRMGILRMLIPQSVSYSMAIKSTPTLRVKRALVSILRTSIHQMEPTPAKDLQMGMQRVNTL